MACQGACLNGSLGRDRIACTISAMSFLSRQQPPLATGARRLTVRRAAAPIRQKLLFPGGGSDCEEEEEEEEGGYEEEEEGGGSGNSTGEDSAFQEADSPLSVSRTPARREPQPPHTPEEVGRRELASTALPGEEGDSWEEEGFGSSSPVKSPGAYFMAGSPPLKGPRRFYGQSSPPRADTVRYREQQNPRSPLPEYPGTPPHKTFRKLRLFDTPHTPKVRGGVGGARPRREDNGEVGGTQPVGRREAPSFCRRWRARGRG